MEVTFNANANHLQIRLYYQYIVLSIFMDNIFKSKNIFFINLKKKGYVF